MDSSVSDYAYDFARRWMDPIFIGDYKKTKLDKVSKNKKFQVPAVARLLLFHNPSGVPHIHLDAISSKKGFETIVKRDKLVERLRDPSVPFFLVHYRGHISVCSYDKINNAVIFMNSFNNEVNLENGVARKCDARNGKGPREMCISTFEEASTMNNLFPKNIEEAEARFAANSDSSRVYDSKIYDNHNFEAFLENLPISKEEGTNEPLWEKIYGNLGDEKEKEFDRMFERLEELEAETKSPAQKSTKEIEFLERNLLKIIDEDEEDRGKTAKSYADSRLCIMYLASVLKRDCGAEIRILNGFQGTGPNNDGDNHSGCQTLVWLIAAFLQSDTFAKDDSVTASDMDLFAPSNVGGGMIRAMAKFAAKVFELGWECMDRCVEIVQKNDAEADRITESFPSRKQIKEEVSAIKQKISKIELELQNGNIALPLHKRKELIEKKSLLNAEIKKINSTFRTATKKKHEEGLALLLTAKKETADIAKEYQRTLQDYVASKLFVKVPDNVIINKKGFTAQYAIRLAFV